MKKILILVPLLAFLGAGCTGQKFQPNECISDEAGYIWHVNNYESGQYNMMGWQGNAWGNSVQFKKDLVERNNVSGSPVYFRTACPEFKG